MTHAPRCAVLAGFFLAATALASGDPPAVDYKDGLLSVRCADAPLAQVLDHIKAATGMALIVEGSAGGTRLTAQVAAQPVSLALLSLFEGTGVDYLLVADGKDPRRIATLYVGDRQTGSAGPAAGRASAAAAERRASARPLLAPPAPEPEAVAVPDAMAEVEPPAAEDEDDEISTNVEHVKLPPAVMPPPVAAPGTGFHPVLDPFGRPIPVQTPEERAARARRRVPNNGQQ